MKQIRVMALVAFLLGSGLSSVLADENMLPTPEAYIELEDRAYADPTFSLDDRQKVMDDMVAAGDKWGGNYEIQWRTAQAIFVYGDMLYHKYQLDNFESAEKANAIGNVNDVLERSGKLDGDQSRKLLELGNKARKYADKAVSLKPGGVEGRYYDAMAISLYAFGKSIASAAIEGLGGKFEDNLQAALKAKPDYLDGAVYAAYGRYWYKLPWPKRDYKKSLEYLLKAKEYGPDNVQLLDFLGDTSYALGKKDEAKKYWNDALHTPRRDYHGNTIRELLQAKLKYAK